MKKTGRGYYEANQVLLIKEPAKLQHKDILLAYIRKMEEIIHEAPEYYLWSASNLVHGCETQTSGEHRSYPLESLGKVTPEARSLSLSVPIQGDEEFRRALTKE